MSYTYQYPRPSVTLDAAVFRYTPKKEIELLLIQRGNDPFKNKWAFPGGFLEMDEEPLFGAARELEEETGLKDLPLKPAFTCGQTGRDPRGRCITMVFACLVANPNLSPKAADDAASAKWFNIKDIPALAFDHGRVFSQLLLSMEWQAQTSIVGIDVFPAEFIKAEFLDLQKTICPKKL